MQSISFNQPFFTGHEVEYIQKAIQSGRLSGDGEFTQQCQNLLEKLLGAHKVLLTTSCTHALEMSALLLNIKPGDEVIVPAFTFVSTANAFALFGARPVFADIREDTLNIDEEQLETLITPQTRAIVPIHYAGVGCEMGALLSCAHKHKIPVVEDNAHGLFGQYKGKFLGTFGSLATQSFHETKNFTCGEGGAIVINDPLMAERAEIIWEKGTNRKNFLRGKVSKYTWVAHGSSYLPAELLAAFLLAQLENRERIQNARRQIWDRYFAELSDWAQNADVRLPFVPNHCTQAYHTFYLMLPNCDMRQSLIDHLKSRGIPSTFHYPPLHLSEMGRKFGGKQGLCPTTETISERLLRLPFHTGLSSSDQTQVIDAVHQFRP